MAPAKSSAPNANMKRNNKEADQGEGVDGADGEADEEPRLSKCRHGNENVSKLSADRIWACQEQIRCAHLVMPQK